MQYSNFYAITFSYKYIVSFAVIFSCKNIVSNVVVFMQIHFHASIFFRI